MASITINGITVDPLAQGAALAAANLHAADAANTDYLLIQTKHSLDKGQKAELASKGVDILEYVPEGTYLCYYKPNDLSVIRALPYVDWANVYMRGFKVAPNLAALPDGPQVRNLLEMTGLQGRTLSRMPKAVDVVLHRNVDPAGVRDKIASAAHVDPGGLNVGTHKVRLTVQARYLPDVAAIDEVRNIEEVVPFKLHNNIARQILRLEISNPGTMIEGEGQLVAVADTGFDKGSTTSVHPAFQGRVVKLYALGRPNKANDPEGHGTHVAGSVLGDGNSAVLGLSVRGAAPKARLVLQSILDAQGGLSGLPGDLHDLFTPPYQNDGARVHSNSWGSTLGDGRYDQNSREVDDFVWNHRDLVVCFAAGNEGTDRDADGLVNPQSTTPPGTARNCITVGATENNRPDFNLRYGEGWASDFPTNPIAHDLVADNPEGMVAFSSRGPTQDQRIKPDVVAPGSAILSTRSRDTTSTGWAPSADPLFFFDGGTSMATPLVAGCAALVREHLANDQQLSAPSAAIVKALLINGAHNISGQYSPTEAGEIPNNAEGFGRVDMFATVGPLAPNVKVIVKDEATALNSGEEERTSVTIGANGTLLKVTLVWTDPPGDVLQNDLDLIIKTADGQERHGNLSPTSADFDRTNNVEQVVWTSPPAGQADIIVRAHRITQFAQPYALVVRTA